MRRPAPAAALLAVTALATALIAAGCGSNGDKAVNGQGHGKLPPPYVGPPRPLIRINLDAGPGSGDAWSFHPTTRPGQELSFRLRIRNAGSVQTGDVRARLVLPRSLQLEPATVGEFNVIGSEPGQPLEAAGLLGAGGVDLGPFPAYAATQIRAVARTTHGASGPLRATAIVSAPSTTAQDTLTIRVG